MLKWCGEMTEALRRSDAVSRIKGIGEKKRERLAAMGITTVEELLAHEPFRYQDRRKLIRSDRIPEDRDVSVGGVLVSKRNRPLAARKSLLECVFRDEGGIFQAAFFNSPFLGRTLVIGTRYVLFGRMKRRNGLRLFTNPELAEEGSARDQRGILPVYRKTSGISSHEIARWVKTALAEIAFEEDWLGSVPVEEHRLCDEAFAYRNIHFPADERSFGVARFRLLYERLLTYQYAVQSSRRERESGTRCCAVEDVSTEPFLTKLPFALTEGQRAAIADLERDLVQERPMNRLVQGDVGCGKTVVAEAAIYKVARAERQSAFMAPTELLARQHYRKLSADLEPLGVRVALLVSGMKSKERKELLAAVAEGAIRVVVGTHALLQEDVIFRDLALVVTDEQHRFGVNQRRTLAGKGSAVNVLVMSATPIPRTLAATVFGDMDFSVIRSRPAARKTIRTRVVDRSGRERAYGAVREQLAQGYRAYVVAPLIEEAEEEAERASAVKLYEEMKQKFPGIGIGLIHGRMEREEKDAIMGAFAEGKISLLVSTVVIEVGIDVAEATIIVIENAERFGLAQLHQLRGRVGRSDVQSYCYLVNYSGSEQVAARMNAMVEMSDGFAISEADYRLRGAGDLMGTMQHGMLPGRSEELLRHVELLEKAGCDAERILNGEEGGERKTSRKELRRRTAQLSATDNSNII